MSKLRSINTVIWSDTWFEILKPSAKLLFIYLVTNEKTNMLGVYEISLRKVSFETGIPVEEIEKYLKEFERENKIKYAKNRVLLINFLKHQNYNFNMMKSAIRTYNELPKELKLKEVNDIEETKEGFQTLCDGFSGVRKYEYEEELEYESEEEEKDKSLLALPSEPKEKIDFKEIVNIYHSVCSDLAKVQVLSDKRKNVIKQRVKQHGLEKIGTVFKNVSESRFLNGESERGWKADFDWIFKSANFIKILEGNYKNTENGREKTNNEPKEKVIGRATESTIRKNLEGWGDIRV